MNTPIVLRRNEPMFRPIGYLDEARRDDPDGIPAADLAIAKRATTVLAAHYPGHFFLVTADSRPTVGMIVIRHPMLTSQGGLRNRAAQWGFRIKLKGLSQHEIDRAVMRGGGELLEAWNCRRGAYRYELIKEARRQFGSSPR